MKKYSRYLYFLALLFFIYIARKYHIYVRIPEDIYLIGFFLCYNVITFCVINIFQDKNKNKLLISLMTVIFILVFIRNVLSNIDLKGVYDVYTMILYPSIKASIVYIASAFGMMFLLKKYSKT